MVGYPGVINVLNTVNNRAAGYGGNRLVGVRMRSYDARLDWNG